MNYPFDVFPGFWAKLIELANNDRIISIDKVKKEICDNSSPDELALWCMNDMDPKFFDDSSPCINEYAGIANWTQSNQNYFQSAKEEFLETDHADSWLIAYAIKYDCIIVTHEVSKPQNHKKIKIPEPCIYFGIRYISLIQMFRELGETF